jgi:hypothetical protein
MVFVIDGFVSDRLQQDHGSIVTVEFKNEIWTVDFLHRRIGDRDFEMSNSLDNENPEIAICDFAI